MLAVVGAFLLFLGITGFRIVHAAGEAPTHKADAIVVFGAAEYAANIARVVTTAASRLSALRIE